MSTSRREKTRRISILLLTGFFSLFLARPAPLHAETIENLTSRADAIVITIPKSKVSYWEKKIIRTRVTLKVRQVVAGVVRRKEITVVYDGGVVGKIGLKVSNGVRLPVGQKALLFLQQAGEDFRVVNQREGVFFVLEGQKGEIVVPAEAVPDTPGVSVKSALAPAAAERGIPLNDFLNTIQELTH